MPSQVLNAKNLWDIACYIELTTCSVCQQGPLCPTKPLPKQIQPLTSTLKVELTCSLCGFDRTVDFEIPHGNAKKSASGQLNSTVDQPSTIIDLAGWLTLFQVYIDKSSQDSNSATARTLAMEARKCLDEGLRFFYVDDDTPPPEAFFSKEKLARFQAQPEHYSRQRLINLRAPLPKPPSHGNDNHMS